MIDRNIQPAVHPIQEVDFIKPEKFSLGNKIPFYILKAGSQTDILRLTESIKRCQYIMINDQLTRAHKHGGAFDGTRPKVKTQKFP